MMTATCNAFTGLRACILAAPIICSATARCISFWIQSAGRRTWDFARAPAGKTLTMSIKAIGRFSVACALLLLAGCARDPVGELAARLKDPHVDVRRAAAAGLEEVPKNDEHVIAALTAALGDEDTEVRYRSANALGKLGSAAKP